MNEQWKDIPGHEGRYQASSLGRIRSLGRTIEVEVNGRIVRRSRKEVILKQNLSHNGYLWVGKQLRNLKKVHRAVSLAFNGPPPPGKPEVNHINGVKTDNRPENLEYVSGQENNAHAVSMGLKKGPKGEANARSVLTEEMVRKIIEMDESLGPSRIARAIGCKMYLVSRVLTGRSWTHITGRKLNK